MEYHYTPSTALADVYLELAAEKAELAKREKALKQALLAMGQPVIEGRYGRVTISKSAPTCVFDPVKAKTFLSDAIVAQCQKERAGAVRFTVKGRVPDARIAA